MFVEVVGGFPFGNIFKADSTTIQIWDFIVLYNDICLKGFFLFYYFDYGMKTIYFQNKKYEIRRKKKKNYYQNKYFCMSVATNHKKPPQNLS